MLAELNALAKEHPGILALVSLSGITFSTIFGVASAVLHRRLNYAKHSRDDLHRQLEMSQASLRDAHAENGRLEELTARLPEQTLRRARHAMKAAARERRHNNQMPADRARVRAAEELREWLDREGAAVARIMRWLGRWELEFAGDPRAGLSARRAARLLRIAALLDPWNIPVQRAAADAVAAEAEEARIEGRLEDADSAWDEVDAYLGGMGGQDSRERARVLVNAADEQLTRGNAQLSERLARAALRHARHGGAGDRRVSHLAKRRIATALAGRGRPVAAVPYAREAWENCRDDPGLGPAHEGTLSARADLGAVLLSAGRWEEAAGHAEEAWRAMSAHPSLGGGHVSTLQARAGLGKALSHLGRAEEGVAHLEAAWEAMRRHADLGERSTDALMTRAMLGEALIGADDAARAAEHLEAVLQDLGEHAVFGGGHQASLSARAYLGRALVLLGRHREALPHLRAAWEGMCAHPEMGPDHPRTLIVRPDLGEALAGAGERDEARVHLQAALADMKRHPELVPGRPQSRRIEDAIERL